MSSVNLKDLQSQAHPFSILYVEDNESLRHNAGKLLQKFFGHVDLAEDGLVGLKLFKKNHYPVVITDIKMPHMDGMQLSRHIHKIAPETKVIIMSAFDDKEFLLQGIELAIFRFLKKPVNVTELSEVLLQVITQIKHEQHVKMFQMHLKNIFEHQSSMVVLLNHDTIILANDVFLEFFDYESLEECQAETLQLGDNFLQHSGFLYNEKPEDDVLARIQNTPDKLYNVKMKDRDGKICHFIIKYQIIPEKEGYGVLSFDDVTDLNLLTLFDEKQSSEDRIEADNASIIELLQVIERNSAKIELHNYYKGLSITHDGVIVNVGSSITLKTTYMQQKAVQIEQKTLLMSNALPFALELSALKQINFEEQNIVFTMFKFVKTSPITRKTIRVVPGEKQTVSLFIGDGKYHGDIEIADISLDAVKLHIKTLPPGLEKGMQVTLDIVLELEKKPLIINTKAVLYRKQESKYHFSLVFMFKNLKRSDLVKYITKRQMALIREIKGMQNG